MLENSGEIFKALRIDCGFSMKEAAEISGLQQNLIEQIENGRNDIKLKTIYKLLEIYDTKIIFQPKKSPKKGAS